MAITNPDSLLDKNGLAYYHSKVKQQITASKGITVNVTQSENQTITFFSYGGHASNLYTEDGYGGTSSDYPSGETYYEAFSFYINIVGDSGYDVGEIVVSGNGIVPNSFLKYDDNTYYVYVFKGGTINISATPATVSTVEYDITFNYDIPENNSVGITFYLPNGETSTYNFTGTGTRTISLPEGTTYDCSMPPLHGYSTTPSNGRIRGTVGQDTEISFGYSQIQYSYYVSFRYSSGGSAATTYKVYVNGTLVESGSGSSATVNGYYGEPFRVEIDPIQGYTTSQPIVTGNLGSGSRETVLFTQSGGGGYIDDPGTPL